MITIHRRKIALSVVVFISILAFIGTVYAAYMLATIRLTFTIPEKLEVKGFLDGEPVQGTMDISFDNASTDTTYNMALNFLNTGNIDAKVSLTVTKPSVDWLVTYDQDGETVSVDSWLNGTLSIGLPDVAPGSYTVTITVNIQEAEVL